MPNATRRGSFDSTEGVRIAWREDGPPPQSEGATGFFWLSGFKSDMCGTKAEAIAAHAAAAGRPCLRFDYSGHGESGGDFAEGSISRWLGEAATAFTTRATGRRIVIGSSMGGWLALLLLRRLQTSDPAAAARLRGIILIAPAVDMTKALMWDRYSEEVRQMMTEQGFYLKPSLYGPEPYLYTRKLIEDGRGHLFLEDGLDIPCPLRILQGDSDPDVPYEHALRTFHAVRGTDIRLTLIKGGDHRLSSPGDIALLLDTVEALAWQSDNESNRQIGSRQSAVPCSTAGRLTSAQSPAEDEAQGCSGKGK
jgi:pimeloyl-ACP methyl ester carboxylesterase